LSDREEQCLVSFKIIFLYNIQVISNSTMAYWDVRLIAELVVRYLECTREAIAGVSLWHWLRFVNVFVAPPCFRTKN
jgi:hypothetical protein